MSTIKVGTMDDLVTLETFLRREMEHRDMSIRDFAKAVGVAHGTIVRLLDSRVSVEPSVDFLLKLAKATNTNVITLLVLAYPELQSPLTELTGTDPRALLRSERIQQLPEQVRDAIDLIIFERADANQNRK